MSSADTTEEETVAATDEAREELLARLTTELGSGVVGSHIRPGDDIWVRVQRDAWLDAARLLRANLGFHYFNFV